MDGTDKEIKDYCLLQVLPDGGKLLGLFNMGSSVSGVWVAQQVGPRLTPSQTPNTDFLAMRHREFSVIQ